MATPARFRFDDRGTRFLVHLLPRPPHGSRPVDEIRVRPVAGPIGPGPSDRRIRVVDARSKPPYKDERTWKTRYKPPYEGDAFEPVRPGHDGHFDGLKPGTRAFGTAATFAIVRSVLEIWQHYFERPLHWFFLDTYEVLELVPRVESPNAWSGEGFLEFGYPDFPARHDAYCENFDTVAHETGHLILKSVIGNPTDDKKTLEYRAHEEGSADLVSMLASLHFDSVVDHALESTQGRLFSRNILSLVGESRGVGEARRLFNNDRLSTLDRAWERYDTHGYSLPYSGAIFDALVAVYHAYLMERGVLAHEARPARTATPRNLLAARERRFPALFAERREAFREALIDARDYLARILAAAWSEGVVEGFSYGRAAANVIAADVKLTGGRRAALLRTLFEAREITPTS